MVTWCPRHRTPWGLFPTQSDARGCGRLPVTDRAHSSHPALICATLQARQKCLHSTKGSSLSSGSSPFDLSKTTQTNLEKENSDLLTPAPPLCAAPAFTAGCAFPFLVYATHPRSFLQEDSWDCHRSCLFPSSASWEVIPRHPPPCMQREPDGPEDRLRPV